MIRIGSGVSPAEGQRGIAVPGMVFGWPDRLTPSAWLEHIPFAFWLAQALRPTRFVELGTHTGASYCAFLQAFASAGLKSPAFAVDTWCGDEHSGLYDDHIYEDLRSHTEARYGASAQLLHMTFDEALPRFEDGSIDLLHIDGFHSFEAVSHDFETWRPKLSPRAVVLFHDTQVFDPGFGVWRFWQSLAATTPHFEFRHGYGLGVACLGAQCPPALCELAALSNDDEQADAVRQLFATLGERISARAREDLQKDAWAQAHAHWDQEREHVRIELETAASKIHEYHDETRRLVQLSSEQAATLEKQARILEEQGLLLDKQGHTLHEQGQTLNEQGRILHEQGRILNEQAELIADRDHTIAALSSASQG